MEVTARVTVSCYSALQGIHDADCRRIRSRPANPHWWVYFFCFLFFGVFINLYTVLRLIKLKRYQTFRISLYKKLFRVTSAIVLEFDASSVLAINNLGLSICFSQIGLGLDDNLLLLLLCLNSLKRLKKYLIAERHGGIDQTGEAISNSVEEVT